MKAMTILTRCRRAEDDLRRIQQRIQQRREAAESVVPKTDRVGARGAAHPDWMGENLAAVSEQEARLTARERAYMAEVDAVCLILDRLTETESAVLYQFYINRQKAAYIAKKQGFSEGYVRKIKADAERAIEAIPEEWVETVVPKWYCEEWPEEEG